ncbi:response regulator [Selenihalanaerobacter shriftii]|uniref:Stage 0 sporulation protein A homolog n=1 Tax=Selenihalanaerobacter shriftii TaxID=142842 RepID=A0A1T4LA86_9FIRM|nr:response regulator [Selenihalanaerobacter shriftii]SJZ51478.1 two-component system, chemotaxis family, response regulator CheY [Selenihalanaerobacter shriftii]
MGKKALVADDAIFMRLMFKDMLKEVGFEVVGRAKNGIEVVELYKKFKPNLVILDIVMPGVDGLTALKRILKIDPEANILVCSAMDSESIIIEAIKNGAKDFLIKPVHPDKFKKAINKIF